MPTHRDDPLQLPYEHLDGEDKNPTDPDVIETVCYSSELDVSLKDSLHGVGSSSRVDRLFTYFGSWNGVMRTFPGASYDNKCGEYDPRIRPWYVAASSGPKDVVIVLDISNSMRRNGFFDVAKDAVQSVLDTMNEFTFVNVVTFNTNAQVLEGDKLVSATDENKSLLVDKLGEISAVGGSDFYKGFELAFDLLEASQEDAGSSSHCTSAILMISDSGSEQDDTELRSFVQNQNADINGQIFTFTLVGNSSSSTDLMKNIACDNGGIHQEISDAGAELSNAMSFYYRYYAIGLSEEEDYTAYSSLYSFSTGGILGFTVASPIYSKKSVPPAFLGVAGVDFSVQSFLRLGFTEEELTNALKSESSFCPHFSIGECQLQQFRLSIGMESVCPSPDNCTSNGTSVFPVRCEGVDYPSNLWDNTNLDGLPFEERICCSEETSDGNTVAACANLCHAGIDSCGREGLDQETTISIVVIFVIVMGLAGLVACVLARWRETERKTERKTPDTQRINSVSVETG